MSSSPDTLRRRRIARFLLAGVLLLAAFVWFVFNVWTAPIGLAWHLLHGNFTSFEGRRIRVPWDFWVFRSRDGGVTISRLVPKYSILRSSAGTMFILRLPGAAPDLSNDYDSFTNRLADSEARAGYTLRAVRKVSTVTELGYCWESTRSDLQVKLSIVCRFDKDTLAAGYGGSPEYRERFYSMVFELSTLPPKSGE